MQQKERLIIEPAATADPTVGRWLAAMHDCRQRTREVLAGLPDAALEFRPDGYLNSIGTLLYHIAAIEADWLYAEIREQDFPAEVADLLPQDVRTDTDRLTPIVGVSLGAHLERLERVRELFVEGLATMTLEDFRRPRDLPYYLVSPEWVAHHLMQHEAGHRGEIVILRALAQKAPA